MTVSRLLAETTSAELEEWARYDHEVGFVDHNRGYALAAYATLIAAGNKSVTVDTFLPRPKAKPTRTQTPGEMRAVLAGMGAKPREI